MKPLVLLLVFFVTFTSVARAVGSLGTEDIIPLLKQNKELFDYIAATLELSPGAAGSRIGQSVNPRLGGARVAPYYLFAKPKGARDWTFEIQTDAEVEYLDDKGHVVDLFDASAFRENFLGITIRIKK
jgi:hypothetical protein